MRIDNVHGAIRVLVDSNKDSGFKLLIAKFANRLLCKIYMHEALEIPVFLCRWRKGEQPMDWFPAARTECVWCAKRVWR